MRDPDFIDQPRPQIFSEAGRVVRRQPNVFVEMEHLDPFPGNARHAGKSFQQFKLGRARRRDDSRLILLSDCTANGIGSLLSASLAK